MASSKKAAIPAEVRREIARRHGCPRGGSVSVKCEYCDFVGRVIWIVQPTDRADGWVTFDGLEMDHTIAEFSGGPANDTNLKLACRKCNRSKSFKSVEDWRGV